MSDPLYSNYPNNQSASEQFRNHLPVVKPRATKALVMALAVKSSEADLRVQALGMMASPAKTEERIQADAEYRIARSIADAATKAYEVAIKEWIEAGQPE